MSDGPLVEFFYCCSCPWTYLAFGRLQEAALRTGAEIVYRPILVDWLHQSHNREFPGTRIDPNPAKAAYAARDLEDWARFCGVTIRLPNPWPVTPEWAQRGAVVAIGAGLIRPYAAAIFRAYFEAGRNIAERAVVLDVASACGLDGLDFAARLDAPETRQAVQDNIAELGRRGGFGSPTMFVREAMFFGNDRLPLVESALMQAAARPFIAPGEHGR